MYKMNLNNDRKIDKHKIMDKSSLYKIGDEVVFAFNGKQKAGVIFIVDAHGTFERPKIPSYDI